MIELDVSYVEDNVQHYLDLQAGVTFAIVLTLSTTRDLRFGGGVGEQQSDRHEAECPAHELRGDERQHGCG